MPEQLSLEFEPAAAEPPRREPIPGVFNVHVALPGTEAAATLPVPAESVRQAEQIAAESAGVDPDRCLALPAREGDLGDHIMAVLGEMNARADEDLLKLRQLHATILGCSLEELDAKVEAERQAEQAAVQARRAARPPRQRGTTGERNGAPTTRLTDRQRELVALVQVEENFAVYTRDEVIPDWAELKSVMLALGGKWQSRGKKKRGGFRFPDDVDAREQVRLALETGEILDPAKAGYFPTPEPLVARLLELAAIKPGERVLEPSAGTGNIATALRAAGAKVWCVELLEPNAERLIDQGFKVTTEDFLAVTPAHVGTFAACCMNPPFSRQQDIKHVLHALSFLEPAGRLAAIMSAGVQYRQDRLSSDFRALVERSGGSIEPNPDGSFIDAGTGVRTVTVFIPGGANRG